MKSRAHRSSAERDSLLRCDIRHKKLPDSGRRGGGGGEEEDREKGNRMRASQGEEGEKSRKGERGGHENKMERKRRSRG